MTRIFFAIEDLAFSINRMAVKTTIYQSRRGGKSFRGGKRKDSIWGGMVENWGLSDHGRASAAWLSAFSCQLSA
jgi:hypothetical protein